MDGKGAAAKTRGPLLLRLSRFSAFHAKDNELTQIQLPATVVQDVSTPSYSSCNSLQTHVQPQSVAHPHIPFRAAITVRKPASHASWRAHSRPKPLFAASSCVASLYCGRHEQLLSTRKSTCWFDEGQPLGHWHASKAISKLKNLHNVLLSTA
eukprot:scaffold18582_cov17-Tisochrysis_lutea.AAC.1